MPECFLHEIFDKTLIKMVVNSDPTSDWAEVGWRGIMLHNGDIWLDDNGKLMSVNYQSEYEARKRKDIISADKAMLHKSLKVFEDHVFIMETETYLIRVDNLGNDKNAFKRLSSARFVAIF